jgi:hypothetical protein
LAAGGAGASAKGRKMKDMKGHEGREDLNALPQKFFMSLMPFMFFMLRLFRHR